MAWRCLRAGRSLARGHRLALTASVSCFLLVLALSWSSGPLWATVITPKLSFGTVLSRQILAAWVIFTAGVYAWLTSPALRR